MQEIIVGLLIVVILLLIINFIGIKFNTTRNHMKNNQDQKDNLNELKLYLKYESGEQKIELLKLLKESEDKNRTNIEIYKTLIFTKIEEQFKNISDKVDSRLGSEFKKTQETVSTVVERLIKIDEAQKNIEKLSKEVFSLNNILTDKKTRGTFGEIQLHHLLYAVFGDNRSLFEEQKQLSNRNIADVILYAPNPLGKIVIDSKFPLNSYQNMFKKEKSQFEIEEHRKQFKQDIKKHIDDISNKYIIEGETAEQAIMFIPAEAIFAEILANYNEIVEYSTKKRVWIVSPTTLISTLTIIQTIVKNIERDKQTDLIIAELKVLAVEFDRYIERWNKLERSAESLTKDIREVTITSNKISKKFDQINEGNFDYLDK